MLCTLQGNAQSVSTLMGARSAGLGFSSSILSDEWSLLNNPAGLSRVNAVSAAAAFETRPSLPGANRAAAVFSVPFPTGAGGIGMFAFGDEVYSEQLLTVGIGNRFGIASLGLRLNYIQYRSPVNTTHALSFSFGGMAKIGSSLEVGAYIVNVNRPVVTSAAKEYLPVHLVVGAGFHATPQVLLVTEIDKDLDYDPIIKGGIEYSVYKKVWFRTGFNLHPSAGYAGLGFKIGSIRIDYAVQFSNTLDGAHQASATYRFEGKKKR